MKTCPGCGYVSESSRECPRCGAQLPQTAFERLLYLYTNTWTCQVAGCLGVVAVAAAILAIGYLAGR